MDSQTKLRYQGYAATPPLWEGRTVSPFGQIELSIGPEAPAESAVFKHHRLGKLVEEFVFHQLKNTDSVSWICDNLQIQDGKRTVGEIDALYRHEESPVHLEVAYKFYLLDTLEEHEEPLAYWIGPNRKDNLFYKLGKLQGKQFPLLHNDLTKSYLESYQLDANTIKQALCFKAQLFLPYQGETVDISPLNRDCIAGHYISYQQMPLFEALEFFIPAKLDWLVIPHHDVGWVPYSAALAIIDLDISNGRSPLIWVREQNGAIGKFFVVFW